MPQQRLLREIKSQLPALTLLESEEMTRAYECDALSAYAQLPLAVALPASIAEVQALMRLCQQHQVPLVPRGAGTGLSAGARPDANALLIGFSRMKRILSIDPEAATIRVEPGVRNLEVSQAVDQYGLFYAPDPSSQVACTIGGNLAENAGGIHCLKYGLTVHNVLAAEVILANGEQLSIDQRGLQGYGLDLLAAIIGSEGMLGLIVEATLKLTPKPPHVATLQCSFSRIRDAAEAVASIIAAGIIPAALEMMDKATVAAVESYLSVGYPLEAEAILLCELDGDQASVTEQMDELQDLLAEYGGYDLTLAQDQAAREALWQGRKSAFPAAGRLAPDYYCMDGSVPRHRLADTLETINALAKQHGFRVLNVFHAGDGNLHPLVLYNRKNRGEFERVEALSDAILSHCIDQGGSISGEHGVGLEKINQMCRQFSREELSQFHRFKQAFDPSGLLNPQKGIPTLHRCAEFGGLHVHDNQLPHPTLPRF